MKPPGDSRRAHGDPQLKIAWNIGGEAAFVAFGCTREHLKQDVVPNVGRDI